jgi:hypothetical protein
MSDLMFPNGEAFRQEFNKSFVSRLDNIHSVAVGREKVSLDYSVAGSVLKNIVEKILSNTAGGIPFIGPFVADIISTLPAQLYEYYESNKLTEKLSSDNSKLYEIGASKIEEVIVEVSYELLRIYEYQISSLKDVSCAARLAKDAVDRIFECAILSSKEDSIKYPFNRNGIIAALMYYKKGGILTKVKSMFESKSYETIIPDPNKKKKTCVTWKLNDIFNKVGLRLETETCNYIFKTDPNRRTVCGYRSLAFD